MNVVKISNANFVTKSAAAVLVALAAALSTSVSAQPNVMEEIVVTAPYPAHLLMEEIVVTAPYPAHLLMEEIVVTAPYPAELAMHEIEIAAPAPTLLLGEAQQPAILGEDIAVRRSGALPL